MAVVRVIEFLAGLTVVAATIGAAIRTFVLPRGDPVLLARVNGRAIRALFEPVARRRRTYARREHAMAMFGPVLLLSFPVTWMTYLVGGFALMFHATTHLGWRLAIRTSGSSLLTLGFAVPASGPQVLLVFTEALIGLIMVALLIAFLPTIYGSFSRREVAVTELSVRAGQPPDPVEMLTRAHRTGFLIELDGLFNDWEGWFVELEETHTSLSVLPFFRSPNPERSWITAAGAVLDAAAIRLAALDVPYHPAPAVCIRAGFLALQSIADAFQVPFDRHPEPTDPIAVAREEFDAVYGALAAAGVPLRADLDAAWAAFAGWRVNYDAVLIRLAALVNAPYGHWSSDRSIVVRPHHPPLFHRIAVRHQVAQNLSDRPDPPTRPRKDHL